MWFYLCYSDLVLTLCNEAWDTEGQLVLAGMRTRFVREQPTSNTLTEWQSSQKDLLGSRNVLLLFSYSWYQSMDNCLKVTPLLTIRAIALYSIVDESSNMTSWWRCTVAGRVVTLHSFH